MADIHPMPAHQVDVDALQQRLEAGEHRLLCEIEVTRAYLEALTTQVAARLAKIHPLSCQFDGALKRAARAVGVDPMGVEFDPVGEALSKTLGVAALYELAGRLEKALPDNCDCSEHGCAELAGIPTGRAD